MTREQVKKIVRLVEATVAKRLNNSTSIKEGNSADFVNLDLDGIPAKVIHYMAYDKQDIAMMLYDINNGLNTDFDLNISALSILHHNPWSVKIIFKVPGMKNAKLEVNEVEDLVINVLENDTPFIKYTDGCKIKGDAIMVIARTV